MSDEKTWLKKYVWNNTLTDKILFHMCMKFVKDFRTKPFTDYVRSYLDNGSKLVCAEIGVAHGTNAENLLKRLNIEKLYLIDCWSDNLKLYDSVKAKFLKYKDKVEVIKNHSDNVVGLFEDEYFDFVYIDKIHTYDNVLNDLNLWYPKIKESGVLGGHGFSGCWGASLAVNEFCMKHRINFGGNLNDWWIRKGGHKVNV